MDKKSVSPRNSFVEAGTHNVTVFGDKIFMEAVRLNEIVSVGP